MPDENDAITENFKAITTKDMLEEIERLTTLTEQVRETTGHERICGAAAIVEVEGDMATIAVCTRMPDHAMVLGRPRHSWEP